MSEEFKNGFTDFGMVDQLDPAVDSLIGQGRRRQHEAHLSPRERRKKAQEREKARKRLPRRVSWDVPEWIKNEIKNIAVEHRVPASQVAALFLKRGLLAYQRGEIDLYLYKVASNSPRYDWNLELGE